MVINALGGSSLPLADPDAPAAVTSMRPAGDAGASLWWPAPMPVRSDLIPLVGAETQSRGGCPKS
jgi:hypothetical protein